MKALSPRQPIPRHHGIVLLSLLWISTLSARPQQTVFHSEVHLVTLTFSVHDASGKLVSGLNQSDFRLLEDGVPQKITAFSSQAESPLSIGLLVDASDSRSKFLKRHIKDVELFLQQILRPQDQVFAIGFGDHIRLVTDLTSSPTQVVDGLTEYDKAKSKENFPELDPDPTRSGGTALFDAVFSSVQQKLASASSRRRVLILFTDGEENSSAHDEIDAIAAAQGADVLVYAVRYIQVHHDKLSAGNHQGIAILHHLTAQTGGTDFDGLNTDLPQAFRQIADELRSQYSLSYYSTNKASDGSFRKVVIEPVQEGFTVRARAGYYASLPSNR
jgi:Ca-activated chloride channel family protein